MKTSSKRLFINNLPDNISESDLKAKLNDYGDVSAVEIKNRKNIGVNQTVRFAYVHINTHSLQECINDFSNKKWKGHWLTVQEAKEIFMDKLKREREEEKSNTVSPIKSTPIETHNANQVNNVKIFVSNNTKRYHSSSSSSEEYEDEQVIKPKVNSKKCKVEERNELPTTDTKKDTPKSSKEKEADQKRLQSLANMKKAYQQQKSAIRSALANVDVKPKNKIIFDDDDLNHSTQENSILHTSESKSNSKDKLRLFDEDDAGDNETYDFGVKEQFEGEKGRKLMSLQSRFQNDKRFTMDARFLEDETQDTTDPPKQQTLVDEEVSYEDEKQKQLDILEEVLGKKIKRKAPDNDVSADVHKKPKVMLRFDPTQPEHLKFEMEKGTKEKKAKDKLKQKVQTEPEEVVLPHVSKDTFYKVDVDLKSALQEKEGFSLANMFDKQIETVEEKQYEEVVTNNKNTYLHEENPFKYDSSSDSENEQEAPTVTEVSSGNIEKEKSTVKKLWTESFFFKSDDYRLQEGLDFIKRLQIEEQDDFQKTRRNLKEIVRAKVKNNQRKNRPFKKKLGGKKRLRVKRALKR